MEHRATTSKGTRIAKVVRDPSHGDRIAQLVAEVRHVDTALDGRETLIEWSITVRDNDTVIGLINGVAATMGQAIEVANRRSRRLLESERHLTLVPPFNDAPAA